MTGDSELFPKPRNWSDSIFWVKKKWKITGYFKFQSINIYNPIKI